MEKYFEVKWRRGTEYILEDTDIGCLVIFATAGGDFSGKLNGTIEPVGTGMTYSLKNDENNNIKFDLILKEECGAYIFAEGNLILNLKEELEEKMIAGGIVDKSEYYYKGIMKFHTSEEKFKFLEKKVFLVEAEVNKWDGVDMEVFLI